MANGEETFQVNGNKSAEDQPLEKRRQSPGGEGKGGCKIEQGSVGRRRSRLAVPELTHTKLARDSARRIGGETPGGGAGVFLVTFIHVGLRPAGPKVVLAPFDMQHTDSHASRLSVGNTNGWTLDKQGLTGGRMGG